MATEERNPKTTHIDQMSTLEMLRVMNEENALVAMAVDRAIPQIAETVDAITAAMENGGRLIYIGAGTSGRLGVLDASECPPTFGLERGRVVGIIAGGERCLTNAAEAEEDSAEKGVSDAQAVGLCDKDVLVGVSASGGAAYVCAALNYAKTVGAKTVSVTCNYQTKMGAIADISIEAVTGAEVVTGSTRLKAGTAQKLILNMLSTAAMIKIGRVRENLMINVRPTNEKLTKRCIAIIKELSGVDDERAAEALKKCNGSIRDALEWLKG